MKAQVSNIQRYSVNDGYGIRTIVFLMGCSLRCAWCQNPETIDGKPALMFAQSACIGCGACVPACPRGAARTAQGAYGVNRQKCESCFACVDVCYFGARKRSCQEMDVDEVFEEVMRDASFFRSSGGGLTMSGGEPLMQAEFSHALLCRVHDAGIHTAVETAGHVPRAALEKVLPCVDLFLYDVKLLDEKKHIRWTGASNKAILDNLTWLAQTGTEIIVRVPLMPGINDGAEFQAIVNFVTRLPHIEELHILPYHTLGEGKYGQLDMEYALPGLSDENEEETLRCRLYAEEKGLRVSVGGAGFPSKSWQK